MVSCSEVQEFTFINNNNNNNIDGTCFNRGRLKVNKKGYSNFSLKFGENYDDDLFLWYG